MAIECHSANTRENYFCFLADNLLSHSAISNLFRNLFEKNGAVALGSVTFFWCISHKKKGGEYQTLGDALQPTLKGLLKFEKKLVKKTNLLCVTVFLRFAN